MGKPKSQQDSRPNPWSVCEDDLSGWANTLATTDMAISLTEPVLRGTAPFVDVMLPICLYPFPDSQEKVFLQALPRFHPSV